ncbi:DUF4112 domain-containing protein [uncultured Roseobacter sp.]|uniref:DUF4112 domain-containing protein n=1 Tax=uncultured Roseobacter sp. TaxID=114847 RepID=UPI00260A8B52|nr:DUF4112 domain-containing protein [uncultured Roseobacter sp.]
MSKAPAGEIEKLDHLSTLLDSRFRIPGTPIRFGWDSLLGLIPGAGDLASLGPSAYLIYKGYRLGARKRTILRMTANTGLDFVIGAAPILGDVFDLVFKANNRNFALLRRDLAHASVKTKDGS